MLVYMETNVSPSKTQRNAEKEYVNGVKERSSNNLLYSAKLLRKFQIVINSACKNFIAKIVSICNINRQHIANNNKFIPKLEHSNVMTGQIHAFKLSLRQSFAWGQGIYFE